MSVERNFHCENCNVARKFMPVEGVSRTKYNGRVGVYSVNLRKCVDCGYTVEGMDQMPGNEESRLEAHNYLIIDDNILSGG